MQAFDSSEATGNTVVALGSILVLDLILRNEDRLPYHQLGWRGNPENLHFVDKITSKKLNAVDEIVSPFERNNSTVDRFFQKNRKTDSTVRRQPLSQRSIELTEMGHISTMEKSNNVNENIDFHIMTIDIGVTRRPPTQKCAKGQELYPGLVEFILNSSDYSSNILYEIFDGKLGYSASDEAEIVSHCSSISYSLPYTDMMTTVLKFRGGFCDALMDLQSFHLLLLTLHQKLEVLFLDS
ncbi:Dual specificity protein phosphatase PHS1 [Platanthera guangdongensis]|uniref:Dual specificity protein phosphatase PHS1 n=1 Tax=Platanthera guangdongensis TaxID=2320717 RepID=A0ABR2LWB2_9ASPA